MDRLSEVARLEEELRLAREVRKAMEVENERLRIECEKHKRELEELRGMIRSAEEGMKEEVKGTVGEGAVRGTLPGSCDRSGAVKKVKEQVDESVSEESEMVVVNEKKEKVQNKDRSEQKGKKGVESKERATGKKISKDGGQDKKRMNADENRVESKVQDE
ncbi:uncharacterized protein LOC135198247 [Macrobrachium nipponense]|uniref:uncharacterized protein LOC135198247 n=1 Tax=Macrobrachium nipponense TaxID=159736 RepID=UPI0030C8CAA2